MTRFSAILLGVLGVQLALAVALNYSGPDYAAHDSGEPLVAFEKDAVDSISIGESGGNSVELVRKDGRWVIPAMADFPASQGLVSGLLDKLAGMEKGWPVATTAEAARRFKLTEADHMRRIVLKSGGEQVAELMIGTSPSFRQAHVRLAAVDEIHTARIAVHDAGTRGEEWMDREFLKIDRDAIEAIAVGDARLEKLDGKLTLAGLAEGETVKEAELPRLISAAASLVFDAVHGAGAAALAALEPADFEVRIEREDANPLVYRFRREESGGAYLFASSAHDYVFRVAESRIEPLVNASRDKLVNPKPEPAQAVPGADANGAVSGSPVTDPGDVEATGG